MGSQQIPAQRRQARLSLRSPGVLKAVPSTAVEWEWLDRAPVTKRAKVVSKRIRRLSQAEAERLLAELPDHLADMTRFSLETGLHRSNATGRNGRRSTTACECPTKRCVEGPHLGSARPGEGYRRCVAFAQTRYKHHKSCQNGRACPATQRCKSVKKIFSTFSSSGKANEYGL